MRQEKGREPWPVKRVGINREEKRECWAVKNSHPNPKITWGVFWTVRFILAGTEYSEGCFDTEAAANDYMSERWT